MKNRCTAILLAAGSGTRMGGPVPKQYMELCGRPLLAWTLAALTASPVVSDVVMVIPSGDEEFIQEKIIPAAEEIRARTLNRQTKDIPEEAHDTEPAAEGPDPGTIRDRIRALVPGGAERYLSVLNGLRAIDWPCDYVLIHDGARPFIDRPSLDRLYAAVCDPANGGTAVAAVPSKDTVKITDENGFVVRTPDRRRVWIIQTPQMFDAGLIRTAYETMAESLTALREAGVNITDDAMLVEQLMHRKVKLVEASYRNIKITTPEDLPVAAAYLGEAGFTEG